MAVHQRTAAYVMKHLYCTVCAEWWRRNRFVFSDCLKLLLLSAGSWDCLVASSRPSDRQQRRPDDRKCWAGNVVRSGDVEWLTVNDVGNVWDWCTVVDLLLRSLVLQTAMHCDSQFVLAAFWDFEPVQCHSSCSRCDKPRLKLRVPVTG